MCNVLPWASDRFGVDQFGTWPACRQHMSVRPAAVAAGARIDCGRRVFVSMLITGRCRHESGHLEKPEISARYSLQAVPYYMREKQRQKSLCFFLIFRKKGTYR